MFLEMPERVSGYEHPHRINGFPLKAQTKKLTTHRNSGRAIETATTISIFVVIILARSVPACVAPAGQGVRDSIVVVNRRRLPAKKIITSCITSPEKLLKIVSQAPDLAIPAGKKNG